MYPLDGEFELVTEVPDEQGSAFPVSFRVKAASYPKGCSVLVTLPTRYPAEGCPAFVVQGLRSGHAATLGEQLAARAHELAGEVCVNEVLQLLEELLTASDEGAPDAADGFAAVAKAAPLECGAAASKWAWAMASGADTLLKISVNSGTKVRATLITNLSELRRNANAGCICIDLQPSRNTENYELASLLAGCLKVAEGDVDFIAGGKKDRASGDRQVRIIGLDSETVVSRILGPLD